MAKLVEISFSIDVEFCENQWKMHLILNIYVIYWGHLLIWNFQVLVYSLSFTSFRKKIEILPHLRLIWRDIAEPCWLYLHIYMHFLKEFYS